MLCQTLPDALLISSQEMEEDPASLPPPEFPEFSPAAADEDPDEEKQDDGVGVCGRAPLLLRQEVGTNTMHRSTAPFQPLVDHTESNSVSERPSPARPDSLSVCESHDGTHNPTAVASTLPSSPSTGAVPEATNSPVVLMSGGSIPCASFATLAPSSANAAAPQQLKEGTPVVVRRVPRSPVAVVPLVDSTDGASVRTCPPPPPPPMPLPSILSSSSSFSKMSQASTSARGGTAQQQQHQHPHNTFVSSMSMRRSQCIVQLKGWEVLEADDAALTHNQQLRQAQLSSSSSLSSGAPAGSGGQPSQQHNAAPGMVTCSSVTVFVRTTGKEESVLPCTATLVGSPSTPPQEQKEQLARGEATSSTIGVLNSTVSSVASAASCSSSSLALLHNPTVKCESSVIVGSQQSPTLRRRKPPPPKLMSARQWESFTAVHAGVRASSPTSSGTVSSPRKVHHQTQNTSTTTKSTSDETSEQTSFPQGSPTWPTVPPAPPPPPVPSSASKPPPRLLTFTPSAEGGGPNPNSSSTCSYHHHHHPSSPAVKSPPLSCPTSATAGGGEGMEERKKPNSCFF